MSGLFKTFVASLVKSALVLCLGLSLLVSACSNQGLLLTSDAVVQESVSMELGETDQEGADSDPFDDAMTSPDL
tara:strand:- start:438 stop:659 length:222 start_codon:yes stop_codon:yes gene_type:complete